ncbi:MAG: tetratricopeptide repeat protein [Bacteroidales bacterium]
MLMIRAVLFFLLLICFSGGPPLYASDDTDSEDDQQDPVDSLRELVEQPGLGDSLRMDALLELAWSIRSSNPNQAMEYAREGLALAEELDYPRVVGRALTDIGLIYWRMGNFSMAYDFFLEARQIQEREGDRFGYARTLASMGIVFSGQGYYDNALEHYFRALRHYEDIDSIARTGKVLNNIGTAYQRQGNYELAEEYHMRSLAIKEEYGDEKGKAFSLNNLGRVNQLRGHYSKALDYYMESLEIREKYQDTREMAATLRNIGILYHQKESYEEAIDHLTRARDLFIEVDDQRGLAGVYHHLGEVYVSMDRLYVARNYFRQSLDMASELDLPSLISDNYASLSEVMANLGNYQTAYRYQEDYLAIQDSIYDQESQRRVLEMQIMYDRERKESEIELLKKTNEINALNLEKQRQFRNFLLLFTGLILILMLLVYNRFRMTTRANKMLEAQKTEISRNNTQLKELNKRLVEQKEKVEELNHKLQESEKHLIETNKTKDKFFSIISHDLRNPFASIVSFSRILKRDIQDLDKDELQELALELDKSVIKISNLLENLLQWSRSQTGKISYNPEFFEMKDIIRDNINLFSANAREKGVEVNDKVNEQLVVWGDVNMTNTIIRNLLSNAIKYTESGGYVELRSDEQNGMVEISVADDGTGISAEDQKKLFRVDAVYTTYGTRDEKGSGLGLLLCKEFVEKQGGSIRLSSREGEGTVFTFSIPKKTTSSSVSA